MRVVVQKGSRVSESKTAVGEARASPCDCAGTAWEAGFRLLRCDPLASLFVVQAAPCRNLWPRASRWGSWGELLRASAVPAENWAPQERSRLSIFLKVGRGEAESGGWWVLSAGGCFSTRLVPSGRGDAGDLCGAQHFCARNRLRRPTGSAGQAAGKGSGLRREDV